jgi:hypothetical protein
MANFNFGHIGAALEAGVRANAMIDTGPIDSFPSSINASDKTIINSNVNRKDYSSEFIWGQKWGNRRSRVI